MRGCYRLIPRRFSSRTRNLTGPQSKNIIAPRCKGALETAEAGSGVPFFSFFFHSGCFCREAAQASCDPSPFSPAQKRLREPLCRSAWPERVILDSPWDKKPPACARRCVPPARYESCRRGGCARCGSHTGGIVFLWDSYQRTNKNNAITNKHKRNDGVY